MELTQSLREYREGLGWTQTDVVIAVAALGLRRPTGKVAISTMTVSAAERGEKVARLSASNIAKALNSGYEKMGRPERFTTEDILELVRREGQKRAEEKRQSLDSPEEDEEDRLAVAV